MKTTTIVLQLLTCVILVFTGYKLYNLNNATSKHEQTRRVEFEDNLNTDNTYRIISWVWYDHKIINYTIVNSIKPDSLAALHDRMKKDGEYKILIYSRNH